MCSGDSGPPPLLDPPINRFALHGRDRPSTSTSTRDARMLSVQYRPRFGWWFFSACGLVCSCPRGCSRTAPAGGVSINKECGANEDVSEDASLGFGRTCGLLVLTRTWLDGDGGFNYITLLGVAEVCDSPMGLVTHVLVPAWGHSLCPYHSIPESLPAKPGWPSGNANSCPSYVWLLSSMCM
jgi:hypothetical protein